MKCRCPPSTSIRTLVFPEACVTHAIAWVATRLSEVLRNERSASGSGRVSSKHVRKKMPAEDSSRSPASIAPPLVVARGPRGRERQQASASLHWKTANS